VTGIRIRIFEVCRAVIVLECISRVWIRFLGCKIIIRWIGGSWGFGEDRLDLGHLSGSFGGFALLGEGCLLNFEREVRSKSPRL